MNEINPRFHFERAKSRWKSPDELTYDEMRYIALDLRITIEVHLLQIVTAAYQEFKSGFKKLYSSSDFLREIQKIDPDFELKAKILPFFVRKRKRIEDYPELKIRKICKTWDHLGDHLHFLNRYNPKKNPKSQRERLLVTLSDGFEALEPSMHYPVFWIHFDGNPDKTFFQNLVSGKWSENDFENKVRMGLFRNFTIIDVQHET